MPALPDYYRIDQRIPEAGVRILDIEEFTPRLGDAVYIVRRYCCGREQTIKHKQIARLIKQWQEDPDREVLCDTCQRILQGKIPPSEKTYGVESPAWPVPPSILSGRVKREQPRKRDQ